MNSEALLQLFSLEGKVALVTGSSSGIGRAIAIGLAQAGATVALCSRSEAKLAEVEQEIRQQGGSAGVFVADLSALDAPLALVEAVATRFGRIDVLVNCAGMNRRVPIADVTPAMYEEIMATNLRGPYFLSQAVLPHLVAQGGGKVIHIGSLTSSTGLAHVSVYGMSKSALAQLTKTQAIEWAGHNIQVNCLCPGFIATELTASVWSDPHRSSWMLDRLPIRRPGTPADLVGMAIYMASPASDYTTGQSIYVDGGFTAGSHW